MKKCDKCRSVTNVSGRTPPATWQFPHPLLRVIIITEVPSRYHKRATNAAFCQKNGIKSGRTETKVWIPYVFGSPDTGASHAAGSMQPYLHRFFSIQKWLDSIAGVCALAASVAQLFSCLEGEESIRKRPHRQLNSYLLPSSKVHKPSVFCHTVISVDEDVEELIWEVERRPSLDEKRKGYSDRNLREKVWFDFRESVVTNWSEHPAE